MSNDKVDERNLQSTPFKDISLRIYPPHPVTDDIGVFENEDAIKRSRDKFGKNKVGERFYNNLLG